MGDIRAIKIDKDVEADEFLKDLPKEFVDEGKELKGGIFIAIYKDGSNQVFQSSMSWSRLLSALDIAHRSAMDSYMDG